MYWENGANWLLKLTTQPFTKSNGNKRSWENIEIEFHLKDTQLIDDLPKSWIDIILKDKGNAKYLVIFYHNIVRKSQIYSLKKLTSKE